MQPQDGDRLPVTEILRTEPTGVTDQVRLVVRDSTHWAHVWKRLNTNFFPSPATPRVDFSEHVVVVAALGSRPTTGYAVTIDSVVKEWRVTRVYVRSTTPGSNCVVGIAFTSPVHVVRIPRTSPIVFSEVEERPLECR